MAYNPRVPPWAQMFGPIQDYWRDKADEAQAEAEQRNQRGGGGGFGGGLRDFLIPSGFGGHVQNKNLFGRAMPGFGGPGGTASLSVRQQGDPSGQYSLGAGRPNSNYVAWDDPANQNNPANQTPQQTMQQQIQDRINAGTMTLQPGLSGGNEFMRSVPLTAKSNGQVRGGLGDFMGVGGKRLRRLY